MSAPLQLQTNAKGAWKTVIPFGHGGAALERVKQAAQALHQVAPETNWRITTGEGGVVMATRQLQQMACVTLGYESFLMPADKAMKVLALMQGAAKCRLRFEDREIFEVEGDSLRLELKLVNVDQVRMPPGTVPAEPRKLR